MVQWDMFPYYWKHAYMAFAAYRFGYFCLRVRRWWWRVLNNARQRSQQRRVCKAERNPNRLSCAEPFRKAQRHTEAFAHSYGYADANCDANAHSYGYPDANAHSYGYADANCDADSQPDFYAARLNV
jgi:hypothetical protein